MSTPPPRVTHQAAILTIILVSYFMILLDNSVIFTALPSLQADLDLSRAELSWVQDAYTLVFGGLLLLGARAGDLFGRRPVFILGLVVFVLASLLIGLAGSAWWIIGARALQGIGAAIVAPASLSLLTASFPPGPAHFRAVALYGATAGIGASLGLLIGGAAAHWLSWRAGFFLNVPVGIAMIALAPRYLPTSERRPGGFDLIGALTATLGMGALIFGMLHASETSWTSPVTLASFLVGAAMLVALVLNERSAAQPIMPLRLFAHRVRVGGYLGRMAYMGAMIGFFFFGTQYLQEVLGMNPLQAGLAFFPMTLVNFVVALLFPRIALWAGEARPLLVGIALTLAGMLWLAQVSPTTDYLTGVALPMVVIGLGQGLVFAPLTSAGIVGASAADAGAASGLVNTFHQLGIALGLALLVAISAPAFAEAGPDAADAVSAEASAAFTAASALLLLGLIVSAALILPHEMKGRRAAA